MRSEEALYKSWWNRINKHVKEHICQAIEKGEIEVTIANDKKTSTFDEDKIYLKKLGYKVLLSNTVYEEIITIKWG